MTLRQTTSALIGTLSALALFALAAPAAAGHEVNASAGMTLAGAPLAIHGYDPVAFFTDGKARLGSAEHAVKHKDAAYRFVSARNRQAFERDPDRYLPQFGGFCAYGVAVGAKFDGDPRIFEIVGGKLYFNLNPAIQKTWKEDVPGNIAKAEASWPTIRDQDPRHLK